ncbi:MAG: coniferyl-alcohol dehydrogenase [Pseudomonadota bacterium]
MFKDKTFVVTGASSGIGAETARQLRAQGARVLGVDVRSPSVGSRDFLQADLGNRASIDRLVAGLPPGIDGLANIAGLPPTHTAAAVLRVNLVGLKYLTHALAPHLAQGASIVNLASIAGAGWPLAVPLINACASLDFEGVEAFCATHGIEGARSYFFSKEALVAWTAENRWTWRARGIRINAISPGPVQTPILKDFVATLGAQAGERMRTMERQGTPADIAPVVAFLLSDSSAWIQGANIPVDGGMQAHALATQHGLCDIQVPAPAPCGGGIAAPMP